MKEFKKKIIAIFLCFATIILLICGCEKNQTVATPTDAETETTQSQTAKSTSADLQNNSPVFMLEELPEIGEYVEDIVYKRRYKERRETLTPGENYGKLIPFIESFKEYHFVDYETGEWNDGTAIVSKYGLMTEDGEIIVDAVFDHFSVILCEKYGYILEMSIGSELTERSLICPSDGSWVIEGVSLHVTNYSYDNSINVKNHLIINDQTSKEADYQNGIEKLIVYDLNGKKLFEIDNAASCGCEDFPNGYIVINHYYDPDSNDYHIRFIDTEGNLVFDGVHPEDDFENGIAIARNDNQRYGIFSSDGKWVVEPFYDSISEYDGYYVACIGNTAVIFNEKFKIIDRINTSGFDYNPGIIEGKAFFEVDSHGDGYDYYVYADTHEKIVCKKNGIPVTDRFYGKDWFYCNYGDYTYIVDINGGTVKTLEGSGELWQISDDYFYLEEGNWDDDYQKYTLYSFNGFKKLWSGNKKNVGDRIDYYFYDSFMVKCYTDEKYTDDFDSKSTYDLILYGESEPILEGLTDYNFCETDDEIYFYYSDGVYSYVTDGDFNILMKTRNEEND